VPFTPTAPPPLLLLLLLLLVAMVIRRHRGVTSSVVARRMRSYSPTRRGARTEIDVRATSVSSTVTALAVDVDIRGYIYGYSRKICGRA